MINATLPAPAPSPVTIRLATDADHPRVNRLRHEVFAAELRQHAENSNKMLHDSRYDSNIYILAERGDELLGFICATPPEHPRYAVERYFSRSQFPFSLRDLYEVRLLTVAPQARGMGLSKALMGAVMRWLDERGAVRVVVTGHGWTSFFYQALGMQPTDLRAKSGDLELVLMSATMEHLKATGQSRWRQVVEQFNRNVFDWQLTIPLDPQEQSLPNAA